MDKRGRTLADRRWAPECPAATATAPPAAGRVGADGRQPHDWLEGRGPRGTLIAFIDDTTSRVMAAGFVPVESTQADLDARHAYVRAYGRPAALYSDRHGIFRKHDPEDVTPTPFQRALATRDIEGIQALTPQAKGRVERLFQSLQDRLVKAMRLAGINDLASANAFLPGDLETHNRRFAVAPTDQDDAHLPYEGEAIGLARTGALHHRRVLSKDLVWSFRAQRYILQTGAAPRHALRGGEVSVVRHADARIELLHGDEVLAYKVFDSPKPIHTATDDKELNARVDGILKRRWTEKSRPASNHPWRQYPSAAVSRAGQSAGP